ncbi:MAG: gliding motility-associated C-terminal domain-containing protein, partial [Bacteroidota bacterium]
CYPYVGEATFTDSTVFNMPCVGQNIIYRRWVLTDPCGNEARDTQIIVLADLNPPSFTTPADVTISCTDDETDLSITGTISNVSDDCVTITGTASYRDSLPPVPPPGCLFTGNIIRIWSLSDACGNTAVDTQRITIQDNVPPDFTLPADVTISCEEDITDLGITGTTSGNIDLCGNTATPAYADSTANVDPCGDLVVIRTWSVSDACGSILLGTQSISVVDTIAPSFTPPADVTLECTQNYTDLTLTGNATVGGDNCSGINGTITYADVFQPNVPCPGANTITRTWTLQDSCGNVRTAVQNILVDDNTPPLFSVPEDITIDCADDPYDLTITGDVFNEFDPCSFNIGEATYRDYVTTALNCVDPGLIMREWELVDACGNVTRDTQRIEVYDNIAPTFTVPADVSLDCGLNADDLTFTGDVLDEADNCSTGVGEATYQDSLVNGNSCDGERFILRVWTLIDDCDNTNNAIQIIYLVDTIAPTFTAAPDLTVDCATDIDDLTIVGEITNVFDDCGSTSVVTSYRDSILNGFP